jgi:hypothetical protein
MGLILALQGDYYGIDSNSGFNHCANCHCVSNAAVDYQMTEQDKRHTDAILMALDLRQYCTEHGLNLNEVSTDAWFNWCEQQYERQLCKT